MLPPARNDRTRPRRHCYCATCGTDLGRVRTSEGQGATLWATSIVSARKTGRRMWVLTCQDGHDTVWTGDQLNWWDVPQAA
jgi:hypothetical protein